MITLELKFENEAAKEKVASFLVEEFDLEVTDGVAPNNTERVGDTIFFTRQPDEVVEPEVVSPAPVEEVFSQDVAPIAETSETVTEEVTEEVTEGEPLPEVSEENVTEETTVEEEEDEYIDEDTPQTPLEHLQDIRDAVEDEISEIEEGR